MYKYLKKPATNGTIIDIYNEDLSKIPYKIKITTWGLSWWFYLLDWDNPISYSTPIGKFVFTEDSASNKPLSAIYWYHLDNIDSLVCPETIRDDPAAISRLVDYIIERLLNSSELNIPLIEIKEWSEVLSIKKNIETNAIYIWDELLIDDIRAIDPKYFWTIRLLDEEEKIYYRLLGGTEAHNNILKIIESRWVTWSAMHALTYIEWIKMDIPAYNAMHLDRYFNWRTLWHEIEFDTDIRSLWWIHNPIPMSRIQLRWRRQYSYGELLNGIANPVAEELVAEEPVAEEPVAEEPVAEEPQRCTVCWIIVDIKDSLYPDYCSRHILYKKSIYSSYRDRSNRGRDAIYEHQWVPIETSATSPATNRPIMEQVDEISKNVKACLDEFYTQSDDAYLDGFDRSRVLRNKWKYEIDDDFDIYTSTISKELFFQHIMKSFSYIITIQKINWKPISNIDSKIIFESNKYYKYYNSDKYYEREYSWELLELEDVTKIWRDEKKKDSIIRIYEYTRSIIKNLFGDNRATSFDRDVMSRLNISKIPNTLNQEKIRCVITNDPEKKMNWLYANERLNSCQVSSNASSYALWAYDFVVSDCHVPIFIYDKSSSDDDYDEDSIIGRMNTRLMYDENGKWYLLLDRLYTDEELSWTSNKLYISIVNSLLDRWYPLVVSNQTKHDSRSVYWYIENDFSLISFNTSWLRTQERIRNYNPFSYYHDSWSLTYAKDWWSLMYDKINKDYIYLVKPKDGVDQKVFEIN